MVRYVALLYSIVLPARRVTSADLLRLAEDAGLSSPKTLLATGNLLFEAEDMDVPGLELRLEAALASRLGKAVPVIVRAAADWLRLAEGNPFPAASLADGSRVVVRVQRDRLGPAALDLLTPYLGEERIAVVEGDLWASFPQQISTTRLAGALTPKRLGIGTMRNWNTVRRIAEALGG